jgi:acyl-CoA thioester hydrolase
MPDLPEQDVPLRPAPEASGWIADGAHHFPVRVYYADTDAGGVVYHANYLAFAERARAECLRLFGWDRAMQAGSGAMFMVRKAELDYLAPALLDDALTVVTTVERLGGASIGLRQSVRRGTEELVTMRLVLVCVGQSTLRPQRLPDGLRAALATLEPANNA